MKIGVAEFEKWKNTFITKWGNFNFEKLPQNLTQKPWDLTQKRPRHSRDTVLLRL